MYKNNSVAVTVPAYNEEGFVGDVIDTIPEFVDKIYVVDDCSTDGTWEEIEKHADKRNGSEPILEEGVAADGADQSAVVVPIRHTDNKGVGGAIKTGYKRALADDIDAVAVMAGDGQMDPDILDRILDPVVEGRAEYSKGNRLRYRDYRSGMSSVRFFGNSMLTFLTKVSSGYWKMMDPQNGYTAISKEALETVDIDRLYNDYGFANNLLVHLNVHGMRVADVPMPAVYRDEQSWIQYSSFIPKMSKLLLSNFLWRLKAKYMILNFHPLVFFYIMGTICTLTSIVAGLYTIWVAFTRDIPIFPRGTLSLLLFMTGSMFVLFAMLFDMQSNESLEVTIYE